MIPPETKGRNLSAADNFRKAIIPDTSDIFSVHSNRFDLGYFNYPNQNECSAKHSHQM